MRCFPILNDAMFWTMFFQFLTMRCFNDVSENCKTSCKRCILTMFLQAYWTAWWRRSTFSPSPYLISLLILSAPPVSIEPQSVRLVTICRALKRSSLKQREVNWACGVLSDTDWILHSQIPSNLSTFYPLSLLGIRHLIFFQLIIWTRSCWAK